MNSERCFSIKTLILSSYDFSLLYYDQNRALPLCSYLQLYIANTSLIFDNNQIKVGLRFIEMLAYTISWSEMLVVKVYRTVYPKSTYQYLEYEVIFSLEMIRTTTRVHRKTEGKSILIIRLGTHKIKYFHTHAHTNMYQVVFQYWLQENSHKSVTLMSRSYMALLINVSYPLHL